MWKNVFSKGQLGHRTALTGRVSFQGHSCGCWQDSAPHKLLDREAQLLRDVPHLHAKWTSPEDSSPSENWLRKSEKIRGHESASTEVTDLSNLTSRINITFCLFVCLPCPTSYQRGIIQTLAQASGRHWEWLQKLPAIGALDIH